VFLLIPMALWLLWQKPTRRAALPAVAAIALVGAALLPLISAQGGHGTQWIGRWAITQRLEAIPQYFLTGYTGQALGHGIELLVALPILLGLGLGLWRISEPRPRASTLGRPSAALADAGEQPGARQRLAIVLAIAACGVLIPIVLVGLGADYLAPRNLVAAMIPVTVVIAALTVWPARSSLLGVTLLAVVALGFLAVTVDVEESPRLQRGNWRDLARDLSHRGAGGIRDGVITTVELGSTPFEYYLPGLHGLRRGTSVRVSEIDETGYAPLRATAVDPPAPGFHLRSHLDVDGLIAYRFVSPVPRLVSEATLRRHVIALEGPPEVLVPAGSSVSE
jgi:hypothetical protein